MDSNKCSLSIVICTYNPDERIFKRVLKALLDLNRDNIDLDLCIVDNNSDIKVESLDYVQDFLIEFKNSKIVCESKQGLSYARIRGVHETVGSYICFVDDDNVLDKNYLQNFVNFIYTHPFVHVWGSGNIDVEFVDPVSPWISNNMKHAFQQRKFEHVIYYSAKGYYPFTPVGSGIVVKRNLLLEYRDSFLTGEFNISDRKGNNLSSNGDFQISWLAIRNGYSVGVLPELKLDHLIPKRRANLFYINKLYYTIQRDFKIAEKEIFGKASLNSSHEPSIKSFIKQSIKIILINFLDLKFKTILFEISILLGQIQGQYKYIGKQSTFFNKLVKFLKLDS